MSDRTAKNESESKMSKQVLAANTQNIKLSKKVTMKIEEETNGAKPKLRRFDSAERIINRQRRRTQLQNTIPSSRKG